MNNPLLKALLGYIFLAFLSACSVVTVVEPNAVGPLKVNVCEDALELPTAYRAFQGLDGWFFFDIDFETDYPLMQQTVFMGELSRALATQGVTLVILPIPSRAVVRPDVLNLDEPLAASFSEPDAVISYNAFLESLRAEGVAVVDVLSAAKAYDAQGGQTFLKRDLHWTTEGAQAVAQETAKIVQQAVSEPLPEAEITLTRTPFDESHRGQFVNRWLYTHCSYVLSGEPLGTYSVARTSQGSDLFGSSSPEVVLTGSSFSGEPYYYDFLADALQSEVLNLSVGAGGAQVGLETYLLDGAYEDHKPQVLVWEFPLYAPPLSEEVQRQLIASVYGSCTMPATRVDLASAFSGSLAQKRISVADHYLQLTFSDLSLLTFDVTLRYQDGFVETLEVNRSSLTLNRGRFFLTLAQRPNTILQGVEIRVPYRSEGSVEVQACTLPTGV